MAKRPRPHVTSDQAVAAVRAIWAQQGAAVEEIHKDYGEDLLVQTQLRGRMDGSRIWIQVKGTTVDLSDDTKPLPSIRVKSTLGLRWTRMSDLTILILWDVPNSIGWFALPQQLLTEFDLIENQKGTTGIALSRANRFDVYAAERLAWEGRIDHAEAQLLRATQSATAYGRFDESVRDGTIRERAGILFRVMEDLQIVGPNRRPTDEFIALIAEACSNLADENEYFYDYLNSTISTRELGRLDKRLRDESADVSPEVVDAVTQCTIVALIRIFENKTGLGAPTALLEDLTLAIFPIILGMLAGR